MPDLWIPGAEVHDLGDQAPTDGGPAKAIAHITWDKNATADNPQDWVSFEALVSYFTGGGAASAPHIIWDPFSGRIAQLFPASSRSKSLVSPPGAPTRTNRAGSVVIQIEAVFFPYCRKDGKVYASLADTPCAGWDKLHAWIKSWGVPDTWPMGKPVNFNSNRNEAVWESQAGWYAHAHVPGNDHTDPGSWPDFTATAPVEEDMPLTDDDVNKVAARTLYLMSQGFAGDVPPNTDPNTTWLINWIHQTFQSSTGAVLDYKLAKIPQANANVDLDALAAKVAEKLGNGLKITVSAA